MKKQENKYLVTIVCSIIALFVGAAGMHLLFNFVIIN